MPDLIQSLQGRDLGHLKIVAELWGIPLEAPDVRTGLRRLAAALLDARFVEEIVADLPEAARDALDDLIKSEGGLPWPLFTRRYGVVREMGPARRDRERPHQNPASPAEVLWYRALFARAFQDAPSGPEEVAYIPDDLLGLLPSPREGSAGYLGRPASSGERAYPLPANDLILDHACTLLAALRLGVPYPDSYPLISANFREDYENLNVDWRRLADHLPAAALKELLTAAGLLDDAGIPRPEPTRAFLEAPRAEALLQLVRAWIHSTSFNELRLLPGIRMEGDWQNDPLRARQAVLEFLFSLPLKDAARGDAVDRPYWSLEAFVAAVRQQQPDFQRPAGDYDSWYLRDETSGEFLRGFEHWEQVDGALLRYMICAPLHWLGILDLAAPAEYKAPSAFRYSAWGDPLLKGQAPGGMEAEEGLLVVRSDARIRVPRKAPRAVRYQVARFCAWEGGRASNSEPEEYAYRLTPASLKRARQQGLHLNHLLALLWKHSLTVPPSLIKALERWDEEGTEAHLEQVLVLRLRSPELLQKLRSSRAARFLEEPLSSTAIIVKPGAWEKVLAALAEMGYLGEMEEK